MRRRRGVRVTSQVTFLIICVIKEFTIQLQCSDYNADNEQQRTENTTGLYVVTFYVRESDYVNSSLVIEHDDHKHKTLDQLPARLSTRQHTYSTQPGVILLLASSALRDNFAKIYVHLREESYSPLGIKVRCCASSPSEVVVHHEVTFAQIQSKDSRQSSTRITQTFVRVRA